MSSQHDVEPLLVVTATFLLLTSLFFGIVGLDYDNGRDFVVADMLAQGKILYRDVHYWYGPFAPWLHALFFGIFGRSVVVLLLAGTIAAFVIVLFTYFLARQVLSPLASTVCSVLVMVQAGYGFSLFCYATPYTFPASYGLIFSLATLYSALRSSETPYSRWDYVSGAAAALSLACKQDFAIISGLIVAASLTIRFRCCGWRLWRGVTAIALPGIAITVGFMAAVLRQVSPSEFLDDFYPVAHAALWRHFYESVAYWGSNFWTGVAESISGFLLNFAFVLWATLLVGWIISAGRGRPAPRLLSVALLVSAPAFVVWFRYLWYYPIILHLAVLGFAVFRLEGELRRKVLLLALAAAFFLFRVLPNPATSNYYGLLYFAPSLIVYLYLCFGVVAPALGRILPEDRIRTAMAAVFVVFFGVPHFFAVNGRWSRAETVATERGLLRLEPAEAAKARVVLEEIRRFSAPEDKILMVPFGPMYYYVSGRQSPSKHLFYIYGDLLDGDEEREEIERLSQDRPKMVVIEDFPLELQIPGPVNTFGTAYNRELNRWLWEHYREVRTIRYHGRPVHFLVPWDGEIQRQKEVF